MSGRTNYNYNKIISRADAIPINSIEDLIAYTTEIDADNRQLFPMQHYWINQSLEVPFSIVKFGQNEMFSDTILAEDWIYTGSDIAFKNDLCITDTISSFTSEESGAKTRVNLANFCLAWKQRITISGTANYDGTYTVPFGTDRKTGDTSFVIDVPFVATEAGTATVINAQFVVQRLNLYANSGTLFDIHNQDTLYVVDSYIEADVLGVAGALDFRFADNLVGRVAEGFKICDCGSRFNVSRNDFTTDITGNSYVFDLNSHDPQFDSINFEKNNLFLQASDKFIIATTEAHKNLTANAEAIVKENISQNVLTTSVENITKTDYSWSFYRNNTAFNFKDSQRIGDFHIESNAAATPLGILGTWYDLNLNALAAPSSAIEGFSLTDATKGILTYDANNTVTGLIISTIVCDTTNAASKIYQFRVLKNGLTHVEGIISQVEVFNATRTLTLTVPVTVAKNDTLQIQVRETVGSLIDITITNMTAIFR